MAGRNAMPIEILQAKGTKHLTKEEIEHRKNAEMKFGDNELKCPAYIRENKIAFSKWREAKHLYKDADFIASGDVGLLARYCMAYAEYIDLVQRRSRIGEIHEDSDDVTDYLEDNEHFDYRLRAKLLDMVSTAAVLSLDKAINQKMDALVKMEDRLFLNPLSKLKNIPKKQKNNEGSSRFGAFKPGAGASG